MNKPRDIVLDEWIDRDLTRAAQRDELPPAFEVGELVLQAEEVLRAAGTRSPVFVGPPGVGKTALVYELVRRAHAGEGAPALRENRVVQFSLRAIASRFKEKSDATNFFADLAAKITASPEPVLPYVRDLHLAYQFDWEPILHRMISQLAHPILGEAFPREFEQLLEYWTDLSEFLVSIPVAEPRPDQVRPLVRRWSTWMEQHQGRGFTDDAQRVAIELTSRFMGDRPFPRKVVDLLRQTLDFSAQAAEQEGRTRPVTVRDVVYRFSQMTRVPSRLVDPDEHLDLSEVHSFVSDRLLGQAEAVDAVVRMIALIKAGLADLRRPFGTFLFVGPTGVGKTHCAQLLSEYLFGDRNRVIRINMADYGHDHDLQLLFGNPYANNVKDQRGLIAQRLAGHPFGVLLLDEFEKAHPKIHDAFLQLFDEGRYINGRSETVSVTSLIVVATSNAGSEVYRQSGIGFDRARDPRELDRELDRRLHRTFRFELLNRFDRVVHFHPLTREHIRSIAMRELADLANREGLVARQLGLDVDVEVLDWLVSHGYHPHYGARFLRREIERSVAATLAEFVVRENPARGSKLALGVRRDRIEARCVAAPAEVPEPARAEAGEAEVVELDRGELLEEARAWVQRWQPLVEESDARRDEAARLIDQSTEAGFWDDSDHAQEVLRRYKTLDARLQADRRLLRPYGRLVRALESPEEIDDPGLAKLVDRIAHNYRRWLDIGSEEGPDAAWLVLGPAVQQGPVAEWLTDLVGMYRAWFRRKGLSYEVVAEQVDDGEVVRVVMEVRGPGVLPLLEMEQGEHRRRTERGIERARVEVVPRREGETSEAYPNAVVEGTRRTRGVAVPRRAAKLTLDLPARGLELVLQGSSRELLQELARDLGAAMATSGDAPELVRSYAVRGTAVLDPRTSASAPNMKDVLRGDLEPFLQAWEAH